MILVFRHSTTGLHDSVIQYAEAFPSPMASSIVLFAALFTHHEQSGPKHTGATCISISETAESSDGTIRTWSSEGAAEPTPSSPPGKPTCPSCQRSFVTLSSRNKHMRTGCKSRQCGRFLCRNSPCRKHFSTPWYQKKHEVTSCRFRSLVL